MNEKLLQKFLQERKEQDWYEFKSSLKLYQSEGKLVDRQRDELLKDILGLANGNSHTIRKTKYLIIGADNEKFDKDGQRILHSVDYKVPTQSELAAWLKSACSPAVVGLECEIVEFDQTNLFIITIPPTFDLHETTRELVTPSGTFQKYVVFMRQDEHTVSASVRDGVTIQQLKHLFRQEIANPPSILIGALAGGIVGFVIGTAKLKITQSTLPLSDPIVQIFFTILGVFFGFITGSVIKELNATRYDWRYMTWRQKTAFLMLFLGLVIFSYFFLR